MEILAAVKGSDKEKRLASQFIAKFFSSFPELADQAIEALFDLCEDEDVTVNYLILPHVKNIGMISYNYSAVYSISHSKTYHFILCGVYTGDCNVTVTGD